MIWLLLFGLIASSPAQAEIKVRRSADLIVEGSLHEKFDNISEVIRVPGYLTTRRHTPIATIIGPLRSVNVYLIGDRVYLRWESSPPPRVGDHYALYTPALLLQNKYDTTDFQAVQDQGAMTPVSSRYRVAGYLYEPNGEVEIASVERGLVIAVVTNGQKKIGIGDHLMLPMPQFDHIAPQTNSGIQLSAAIVMGSPPERISPTVGSFMYLNRGSRDGVRIGQIFQVIEKVPLLDSPAAAPTESMGEVKVVYTTETFSTALVTKQVNAIRLGGLLMTKQTGTLDPKPFKLSLRQSGTKLRLGEKTNGLGATTENLSELDALERRAQLIDLSPEERQRLEGLQAQDLRKKQEGSNTSEGLATSVDPNAAPELPEAPKIGTNQKTDGKKKTPLKKKRSQDEENLNELMQF